MSAEIQDKSQHGTRVQLEKSLETHITYEIKYPDYSKIRSFHIDTIVRCVMCIETQ